MQCMAIYLIGFGREVREAQDVYVTDHLPCANTIKNSMQQVCEQERLKLKNIIQSGMHIGGTATCDV